MTVIDISKSRLGPHAFNCLMYAVARAPASLTALDASSNLANNDCCAAVGYLVSNSQSLVTLNISNNPLTTSLGDQLGKAMKSNKGLKALDVSATGVIDATTLFQGLSGHCLEMLNVSNNACGKGAWSKLSSAMAAGMKLKTLKAAGVEMGDEGASMVATGIRSTKSLIELDLSSAGFGNEGMSQILDACTSCPGIVLLSLSENKSSSGNHDPLTRSLGNIARLGALAELNLAGCEMSSMSVDALLRALPTS
eukprot:955561-Rhodomonas_salina.2